MIQAEEIKKYVKKINNTTKHNQALRDNMGTVLSIAPERIRGTSIIYQTFPKKNPLAFHQGQDLYIWNRPHFKWILLCSYEHEVHILPKKSNRKAYGGVLQKV